MRDDQNSVDKSASTTPPPRSPPFSTNRNAAPSYSPLSATSNTAAHVSPIPIPIELNNGDHSDGSSSLSDYDAEFDEQDSKDNNDRDSEAETERLERSPQKSWIASPTKLNQATAPSEPASSPVPQRHSPSPTNGRLASPTALAGRKRKRPSPISDADSPLSEHSDSEEALALNHDLHVEQNSESRPESPEPADDVDENPYISPMKAARLKRAKQKSKQTRDLSPAAQKTDLEAEDEDVEEQNDDDDETKKRATEAFTTIVEQFQTFRAKMHAERLASAEAELEQLNLPHPTHPDYLSMLQCITSRRDTKIQQDTKLHQYKLITLRNQILGERAQLHTQYLQEVRDVRDTMLSELGKQWYDIQKERRQFQADEQDNYSYKFLTKRSEQVRNQEKYNREVSILSGMAKYRGFPAAPDIHGARDNELDDDFKAMQLPRRQTFSQQAAAYQNHMHMHTGPASGRTAEERFIEQTPWANPQHPLHHQSRTPNPFGSFGMHLQQNLVRQGSAQAQRTASPFTTPLPNPIKRAEYPQNGLGSNDTIGIPSDPPSSAVPQTADRFAQGQTGGDVSPTDQLKVRSALGNPLANREDRRNFSGISSASTIETPSDPIETDRLHGVHQYTSGPQNGHPPHLHVEQTAPQQAFVTSAIHAQNVKPEDRRPELYENINFRRPQLGTYGTPLPLFGTGSPATHQDGQKAA